MEDGSCNSNALGESVCKSVSDCETQSGLDVPVGQGEPVGRQDGTISVNEDRLDPQQVRDLAGMLPACPSEARQSRSFSSEGDCHTQAEYKHMLGRCVAPRLSERTYRPAHRLVRNLDETSDVSQSGN